MRPTNERRSSRLTLVCPLGSSSVAGNRSAPLDCRFPKPTERVADCSACSSQQQFGCSPYRCVATTRRHSTRCRSLQGERAIHNDRSKVAGSLAASSCCVLTLPLLHVAWMSHTDAALMSWRSCSGALEPKRALAICFAVVDSAFAASHLALGITSGLSVCRLRARHWHHGRRWSGYPGSDAQHVARARVHAHMLVDQARVVCAHSARSNEGDI